MRLLIFVVVLFSTAAHGGELSGTPRVLDGDTLAFGQVQIRLTGIDTPETGQKCGALYCGSAVTEALATLVESGTVMCTDLGQRWDGRIVVDCTVNGQNISQAMVENGWAFADPTFGKRFHAREGKAEERRAGLWAHCFTFPWNWRQGIRKFDYCPHVGRATCDNPAMNLKTKKTCYAAVSRQYHQPLAG